MPRDSARRGAVELLSHFLPQQVLQELHDRAVGFQRDEQFRIYLLRRLWFIIPIALVSVLIGSACAAGAMYFLFRGATPLAAGWLAVGVGVLVWLASILSQWYALLAWLRRRARTLPQG